MAREVLPMYTAEFVSNKKKLTETSQIYYMEDSKLLHRGHGSQEFKNSLSELWLLLS